MIQHQNKNFYVLFGSDYLWKIQLGVFENISKDLYATEIIFGHTIHGQILSKQSKVSSFRVSVENDINELIS